jgi:two-component system, response regulator
MTPIKRILLVEDSEKDIELTMTALGDRNLANEVVIARDGVEALDYLYHRGKFAGNSIELPCVVFLDLKMPRMNGLEVLAAMKTDPRLKNIPVVMVTSSREEPDLIKSYELGVNAYVVKPVDFQQFMDSIKALGFFWAVVNELPPRIGKSKEDPAKP